jgi:hypothetical protein
VKNEQGGRFNLVISKGPDGAMQVKRAPIREIHNDLKQIIEEMK